MSEMKFISLLKTNKQTIKKVKREENVLIFISVLLQKKKKKGVKTLSLGRERKVKKINDLLYK